MPLPAEAVGLDGKADTIFNQRFTAREMSRFSVATSARSLSWLKITATSNWPWRARRTTSQSKIDTLLLRRIDLLTRTVRQADFLRAVTNGTRCHVDTRSPHAQFRVSGCLPDRACLADAVALAKSPPARSSSRRATPARPRPKAKRRNSASPARRASGSRYRRGRCGSGPLLDQSRAATVVDVDRRAAPVVAPADLEILEQGHVVYVSQDQNAFFHAAEPAGSGCTARVAAPPTSRPVAGRPPP